LMIRELLYNLGPIMKEENFTTLPFLQQVL